MQNNARDFVAASKAIMPAVVHKKIHFNSSEAYGASGSGVIISGNGYIDLVKKAIVPDVDLGAHTASLGLAFDEKGVLPGKYKGAAFIGQHGSWNRSQLVGYKVVFVPFKNGRPLGQLEDFLTGFLTGHETDAYGRPVGVAFSQGGALLVADDAGNTIWEVRPAKQ